MKRVAPVAGVLLLSSLWSFRSLQIDLFPSSDAHALPPLEKEALTFFVFASAAGSVAWLRKAKWPRGWQLGAAVLVGIGLFLAPTLVVQASSRWISDLTRVALFALVPVFAVVCEPYIGAVGQLEPRGGLQAALAALGGMLCIFPVDFPNSVQSGIGFIALILAAASVATANCAMVKIAIEPGEPSTASLAAIASATAAAGLAVFSLITERASWTLHVVNPEFLTSLALGCVELLLLFWLAQKISAARMSTRYLIAPLIAAVFGLLYLRISLSVRTGIGLSLLTAGAGWLLFGPVRKSETISLRTNPH